MALHGSIVHLCVLISSSWRPFNVADLLVVVGIWILEGFVAYLSYFIVSHTSCYIRLIRKHQQTRA